MRSNKLLLISTHTSPTRGFGGPSVSFRSFINQLNTKSINYKLITTCPSKTWINKNGLNIEIFCSSYFFHKQGFSIRALYEIIKEYRNSNSVCINGLTTFTNFISLCLFSFNSKIKVVLFPRGGLESGRTSQWFLLKKLIFNIQLLILRKLNLSNSLLVVFATKSEMKKSSISYNYNSIIMPNVNSELFTKDLKLNNERKIDILYVGRYSYEKGIDRLLNLLKSIPSKSKISLCLVFDKISSVDMSNIKSILKNKNYKVLVGVENQNVLKIMSNSKYLFFPSYVENYGNVLVEAVSQGVIPIVYNDTHWRILIKKHNINYDFLLDMIKKNNINWNYELAQNVRKLVYNDFVKTDAFLKIVKWTTDEI